MARSMRTAAYVLWRTPGGSLAILPRRAYRDNIGEFLSSHRTRAGAETAANKLKKAETK